MYGATPMSSDKISCTTQDRIPLSKKEAAKAKRRLKEKKALGPEDEPGYAAKVKKERKAAAEKKNE
jgi:hypothetical protein